MYNCGKVCLSLLGTWSGAANESWNDTSTLLQVLVSIQSLILVDLPYFNEPGYQNTMGTSSGTQASNAYNYNIREQTVRWAMIGQLRSPSPGFEDVIQTHFRIKGAEICAQIRQWIDECKDSSSSSRTSHAQALEPLLVDLEEELERL